MRGARQRRLAGISGEVPYPTNNLKGFTMKTYAIGMVTAAAFIVWGLFFAIPAKADPHTHDEYIVCAYLDTYPNKAGVVSIMNKMLEQMSSKTAADTMYDAVSVVCPQYYDLVFSVVNDYTGNTSTPAITTTPSRIGGRI